MNYKLIIISLSIAFSIKTASAKPIFFEGIVTANSLNVRKEANTNSQIISSLSKDSKINILGTNKEKNWYQIEINNKTGWVSKEFVKSEINGNIDYTISNSIGNSSNFILNSPIKIFSNEKYIFIIDFITKYEVKIYDRKDLKFIKNIPIEYKWILDNNDKNNITLTADLEGNYYTNDLDRNIISKFDIDGNKITEIKNAEIFNIISTKLYNNYLYILDNTNNIKVFDKENKLINKIFLSETKIAKDFFINNNNLYVLDYPENEKDYYKTILVNSYNFGLRRNYDISFKPFKLFTKGSILKYDNSFKNLKSKDILDDGTIKENNWIELIDNNEKLYSLSDDIKIVNIMGEIDNYDLEGKFIKNISLNSNYQLKTPDRNKSYSNLETIKKIIDIYPNNDEIVLSVISSTKDFKQPSLNYYFINPDKNEYRLSHYYDIDSRKIFPTYFDNDNIFIPDRKGYINIIDKNMSFKESFGNSYLGKLNNPYKLSFINNNRIILFDKGNYSFGIYDLNLSPIKVKTIEQKIDLFEYIDFISKNNKIYLFKKAQFEKDKLGLEVYDQDLNKIFDKWLINIDIDEEYIPKFNIDNNENITISTKGNIFGKKGILFMFNKFGHLINNWEDNEAILNGFGEEEKKLYKSSFLKILNFDNNSNTYIMLMDRNGQYKIIAVNISEDRKITFLKEISKDFFGNTQLDDKKNEIRKFNNSIDGNILDIIENKNNVLYFLFREKINNNVRLGVFNPAGEFWKEYSFGNNSSIKSFTLDNSENLWLTDGTLIKKYSN